MSEFFIWLFLKVWSYKGGSDKRVAPRRQVENAADAPCIKGVFARPSVLSAQLAHTQQLFSSPPPV